MTLPEDVLAKLGDIDVDLGQAIVMVVERQRARVPLRRSAELASYGNHAVILVAPVKALKRLAGVQLVPVGNGRALVSLQSPQSIPQLELALRDALDSDDVSTAERQTLAALADILRRARLSRRVSLEERTIIVLESRRQRAAASNEMKGTRKRPIRKT